MPRSRTSWEKRLTPAVQRLAVARVIERHGLNQGRTSRLIGIDHSVLHYQPERPHDTELRSRLRELAAVRRRFGYRRLGWLLTREGYRVNRKKLYRLYREEKLMVRRRGGRKRALGTRARMLCCRTRSIIGAGASTSSRTL